MSTRYYNSDAGRFLNADAFASTGQGLLGNNVYMYCLNNPIIAFDSTGNMCVSIIKRESSTLPVTVPQPAPTPEEQTYGVINGQALLPYADTSIGWGSYGSSGCPYIAAYNALQLSGNGKSLAEVTHEIFFDYGTVLFGAFGVAPRTLSAYLCDQGIVSVKSSSLTVLLEGVEEGSIITFTIWNKSNNPFAGWHAMTALYTNGEYWVFDRYNEEPNTRKYSSLPEAINGGAFLHGVRIDPQ